MVGEGKEADGIHCGISGRWITTHYAAAAGLNAGILTAGNAAGFVRDPAIIRTAIRAIREGFAICLK